MAWWNTVWNRVHTASRVAYDWKGKLDPVIVLVICDTNIPVRLKIGEHLLTGESSKKHM